jgi:hypothetical protein
VSPIWWLTIAASLALITLSIAECQRRSYFRHYPFLAAFLVAQLLVTVAEMGQLMQLYNASSGAYARIYWTGEFLTATLLLALMISFISRASEAEKYWIPWVVLVLVGAAALSWFELPAPGTPRRQGLILNEIARNLSFSTALLNVLLFRAISKFRHADLQLQLLSLGIGLWTAGRAAGQSMRLIGPDAAAGGDVLLVVAELFALAAWYVALSRFPLAKTRSQASLSPQLPTR